MDHAEVINPDFVLMLGPDATQMYFTTGFADPATEFEPFQVGFASFNGNTLIETALICWNGRWDIFNMGTENYDRSDYNTSSDAAPVPEPGTMLLFGIGMIALAITGKRRQNARAQIL